VKPWQMTLVLLSMRMDMGAFNDAAGSMHLPHTSA
jgi:hypothetical protein